jgi:hypothetical protein
VKRILYLVWVPVLALALWPLARPAAAPRCKPTSRFVVLSGGMVRDTLTKLVWQQQSSAATMNWADAKTYCASSGLRLPTVKELESLVDLTIANPGPTIDKTAFPGTPAEAFWTSSPYVGSTGGAWIVYFGGRGNSDAGDVGYPNRVRCVR